MGKRIANPAKVEANAQSIAAVQDGLAYIVGNTNTTGSTLAVGQFVYVKGHSTIDEGLRKVTASISANANITTSNTSACSEGGLNALNSKLLEYSTTEKEVGTWINGKKIYRKSFSFQQINSFSDTIPNSVIPQDVIAISGGITTDIGNNSITNTHLGYYGGLDDYYRLFITELGINVRKGQNNTGVTLWRITVDYLKD